MSSPWLKFKQENNERWEVLDDGFPIWMHEHLLNWFSAIYKPWKKDYYGTKLYPSTRYILTNIEANQRIALWDDLNIDKSEIMDSIRRILRDQDQESLIIFLDLTVQYIRKQDKLRFGGEETDVTIILQYLDMILSYGSKWTVVRESDSNAGLIERTNGQILSVAKKLNIDPLTRAWNEAFAVKPNPELAIEYAQKAVESVASHAGLTKATTKVYNTLLGDIKSNPEKYKSSAFDAYVLHDTLAKKEMDINKEFSLWFASSMDLVQKANPSRHASMVTKGFHLNPEAAKQAILITTILCDLIANKHFLKA